MANSKKIISGVKPTGRPHIGNYFGAMKQFVDLQDQYDSIFFIANLHALTTIKDGDQLRQNTFDVAADYLAIGLDPEKCILFIQSDVPAHTELSWIFSNLVTVPYLERAHAYKDAVAKGKEPNAGLFTYPVLMAADILLYNVDLVPVGEDQRQHVEYAREIARKFNSAYGEVFKIPKELVLEDVATVPGTDGQKMSKSYGNTIPLFAEDDEIERLVMSIPTDSKGVDESKNPEEDNVFKLHKLFAKGEELAKIRGGYEKGGLSYAESKKMLVKNIQEFIAPLRLRRKEIEKDKDAVVEILKNGAEKARQRALPLMNKVRQKVGLET